MTMVSRVLLGLIAVYRLAISPWLGRACRFTPSCSAYAADAIRLHGPFAGLRLAAMRLMRCQPWGGSGWDPVPAVRPARDHEHGPSCGHSASR